MPKINVAINRLKWNLACINIAMQACLMQNLSLVVFLVFEILCHKICPGRCKEMDLTVEKNEFLCPRFVLFDPKLVPHVNFSNFQGEQIFFIFKCFGTSR